MIHINDFSEGRALFEALDSDVRLAILDLLLKNGEMNLKQIAVETGLTGGAITAHIKRLQDAGLIQVRSSAGVRGAQKICSLAESKIIIDLTSDTPLHKNVYTFDIPISQYCDYKVAPTCGLVTLEHIIGELDDPRYFAFPERSEARLLWFTTGFVSYQIPNSLKLNEICTELQISMELASEAPGFTNYYPSDISFRLNGVELGYFTSLGEFNDRRGIFTPSWWFANLGQYGKLKMLTIGERGCFIDGLKIGDVTIQDLNITSQSAIRLDICVKEDAKNAGGCTLFGKGFGDYDSGILVRMFYADSPDRNLYSR